MIYLDANFFIFSLIDNTSKGEKARKIHAQMVSGKMEGCTSALAIDEIMWVLLKSDRKHLIRTAVEGIYATPHLTVLNVSPVIPLRALDLMETKKLKPRDAFHAGIMIEYGIKEIVTDDSDFDRMAEFKRIRL
jgi:predicted nucleic acid-binding protein